MRTILFLLFLFAAPVGHAETQEIAVGDRLYLLDLPARPQGVPVIVALHGGGGSPRQFARSSGLAAPALRAGYAVVWPAGTGRGGRG